MIFRRSVFLIIFIVSIMGGAAQCALKNSAEPPMIPVGIDAYRMWDRWAYLRIGQRTYMPTTASRTGDNSDPGNFLYQLPEERNVTMDVTGPGVLAFARYNHWHGSPWHYIIDGEDHIIKESSSDNPRKPVEGSVFIPEKQFPSPLAYTWSTTKGADLMWVPLPFEQSFTMAYTRTHYSTGYYIYHKFPVGAKNLSRPIKSWTMDDVPPQDVINLINSSGEDIAPKGAAVTTLSGIVNLEPEKVHKLATITRSPSTIRAIKFIVPRAQAAAFGDAHLRIFWDDSKYPSVDAPVKLFFGTGSMFNRENKQYLVKGLPLNIRFDSTSVRFACYFPMPFMKSARIELLGAEGSPVKGISWSVRYEPYRDPANWVCNFHATYVDHGTGELGYDLVLLDTTKLDEGGGDWCGHFVGTSFIFSDNAYLSTLEGDPRFFFDDSNTPQAQGTGTEEWGGGGDYWGGANMTLPFAGHPVGTRNRGLAVSEEDKIESAYRFLLTDLMPFGKNARIQLEHGDHNNTTEHYRTVTYWYGLHQACLKQTDSLHVSDTADEAKHNYESPTASPVQTLTSRYELSLDFYKDKEIHPATTDTGRYMTGISTFTLQLDPKNVGALLRRKFDYNFPNQYAKVYVADMKPGSPWKEVGEWYSAGSQTVLFSDPPKELDPNEMQIRTSGRRWKEDEFLLPDSVTRGRSAIRIKLEFTPKNIPLFPGQPMPEQAWSEYRYTVYCYVMPKI